MFVHCICINHYIIIRLHLACFCSANCIYSTSIIRMSCSLMRGPCIFLCKNKKRKEKKGNKKNKKKTKKESHTIFLVTCVGYHDNGYKPTMLGLYTYFSKKKIENHVNVVPNAWITRKMMVLQSSQSHNYICCAYHEYALVIHLYDRLSKYWQSKLLKLE